MAGLVSTRPELPPTVGAVGSGADERREALLGGERTTLEAVLDDLIDLIHASLDGLPEEETRRHLVPSSTTLLGIVQHAAAVERFFFQRTLEGRNPSAIQGISDATECSWDVDPRTSVADVLRDHQDACTASRAISARYDLDDVTSRNERRGPLTLRWIYVHMIAELARHAAHADILREQIKASR